MDSDYNRSDNVNLLCVDSDLDLADTTDKRRPTAESPQAPSTEDIKSNLQESFSTQVLEYYKHSAGQEIVSEAVQSQSIGSGIIGSLSHGTEQQTVGLCLEDVGLGLGLSLESEDARHKFLLLELGDDKPWDGLGLRRPRTSPITSDEIIAIPRKNIPKHVPIFPEPDSRPMWSERKKIVKPPLLEHTSGSDDTFDGHVLFSEQNSLDYQRNFASRHIGPKTGDKHHSKPPGIPHQTRTMDNFPEKSPNVGLPNITFMEDRSMTEHEGSNESRPKSALDISLDASGFRASSPSSSIASNKRGLEWDSGADVGYHYHAKDGAQVPQITTFERIALARGSRAYQLTSDLKTGPSLNCQPPDTQTTELSSKSEQTQMKDGIGPKPETTNKPKSYQRTEGHVQTFPPKHVSDVKAYRPLHNTLSEIDLCKFRSGGASSKVTPPQVQQEINTETSEEELTLKQSSHGEHANLSPLAQSTPLDGKQHKTKARLDTETKRGQAKEVNGQNNNPGSGYFPKRTTAPEISFIPREGEAVGKMLDLHASPNRGERSDGKENASSNVQTPDMPAVRKPTPVFRVEEVEAVIRNIQRKATEHQEHIDRFVQQANDRRAVPHTFPRTRRDESSSRDPSARDQWGRCGDRADRTCRDDCRGAHKKTGNRSESTTSPSPCVSRSCSSASGCYSDAPRSGNVANERDTVGSAGSFEYFPGHVYEKTNVENQNARNPNSLREDLKCWAQLCHQDDVVIMTKDVVNQIVHTNYPDDEKSEMPLQTGGSDTGSECLQSERPLDTGIGNFPPRYCDKGTQISSTFSTGTASSDVESNTSSRRPSLYNRKGGETSDGTCGEATQESSCKQGRTSTLSSAGYNTSTSRSPGNCEAAGDWRSPATQSEHEFESRNDEKRKSKRAEAQNERLAVIDQKINHLNNLKMILERQDQLKKTLGLRTEDAKIDGVPLPKQHHSVYTVMTATVDLQSAEVDEEETGVREKEKPSEDRPTVGLPAESSSEVQSNSHWASHHHLIPRNTREISTQVPSSVSLNVLKEQNTNTSLKDLKKDMVENKSTKGKKEICTQTPSCFDVAKPSDTDSVEGGANQGTVNVYVQTTAEDRGQKNRNTNVKTATATGQLCCCQCEENLSIIKERATTLGPNAKQSSSTESCPVSCDCKCHHKRLPKNGHCVNRPNVPISVRKSPEPCKENTLPVLPGVCNCKVLTTSIPIMSANSACTDSTCHSHHSAVGAVLKNTTVHQVYYQPPFRLISDPLATPTPPRNATRNTATSTVDNKGVQTTDSVSQLPIIRPLWFSTSNSHVKIRGKKCVCCSHQPVKNVSQDSKITFEENCRSQRSSKRKSEARSEDVRCPHDSSVSGSRREDVRCPHISSTCKSGSSRVEGGSFKCHRCRQEVKVCRCRTTGTSEDSWDVSAVTPSTASRSDDGESVATPRSIGYVITFETVAAEQSSSHETVRRRSLQEVKVKIPAAKRPSQHKNHTKRTHRKQDGTRLKTADASQQERSFQEVRAQIPSRRPHRHREEKPTEILNSNGLGRADSKSDFLQDTGTKSEPDKKTKPTLQDYLRQARPDYIKMAEARRRCLAELADLRLLRHEDRQRLLALASHPGSVINTDILSSANSMLPPPPMAIKRVFNQRVMRKQTERGYQKCPEVVNKKVDRKRKEDYRTNRLMAEIFTKKLQKKALRGDVNLSNSVSVISIL